MNASSETKCRLPILGIQQPAPWFSPAAIIETHPCVRKSLRTSLSKISVEYKRIYFDIQIRRAGGSKAILRGFMNPATVCRVTDPRPVPGAEARGGRLEDLWGAQPADLTSPQKIDTPKRALLACKDLRAHVSHKRLFGIQWFSCSRSPLNPAALSDLANS